MTQSAATYYLVSLETVLINYAAISTDFVPTFRDSLSEIGQTGCPKTSVRNYHYSPRNDPEERSSDLLRGGSLKSHVSGILLKFDVLLTFHLSITLGMTNLKHNCFIL